MENFLCIVLHENKGAPQNSLTGAGADGISMIHYCETEMECSAFLNHAQSPNWYLFSQDKYFFKGVDALGDLFLGLNIFRDSQLATYYGVIKRETYDLAHAEVFEVLSDCLGEKLIIAFVETINGKRLAFHTPTLAPGGNGK